jgi:hypothetical protein
LSCSPSAGTASNGNIYALAGTLYVNGNTTTTTAALSAVFQTPWVLATDTQGNILMGDFNALYRLSADFSTVENLGWFTGSEGYGSLVGVAVLANGTILLSRGFYQHICRYDNPTTCTVVAGIPGPNSASGSYSGDGGPATSADLNNPTGIAAHPTNPDIYYIADLSNNRIRMVNSGVITTVAGNGTMGYGGDGGPATSAALNGPCDVAVDAAGNLFIADTLNNRIRCPMHKSEQNKTQGKWKACEWNALP